MQQELERILKPLRLEARQGFLNRAVTGGLDRFVVLACERLAPQSPSPSPRGDLSADLLALRKDFTQYLTLDPGERRLLVERAVVLLERWAAHPGLDGRPGREPAVLPVQVATGSSVLERGSGRIAGRGDDADPPPLGWDAPLLPFVNGSKTRAFARTGLRTVGDLLRVVPKWVVHRSRIVPIARTGEDREPVFIKARINGLSRSRGGPRGMVKAVLEDGSGHLMWVWFNRPYLDREIVNGRTVLLHDSPENSRWGRQVVGETGRYEFLNPQEERDLESGRTLVFYPSTPTLDQAFWRGLFNRVLEPATREVRDVLAPVHDEGEAGLKEAFFSIHRPSDPEGYERGRRRLALDELLSLQVYLRMKRKAIESRRKGRTYRFDGERVHAFRDRIPFLLTGAQKRVLKQLREDLARPYPMNRLLQGDVGSGKTVVAAIAFLYAADSGVQGAFLAPTEILAEQHFSTLGRLVAPCGLRAVLLTGEMRVSERRAALKALERGEADVAVGTHALLEEDVRFRNLGLAVMDERHKFGVLQRAALERKGAWPDCLMMTATPFPRALVLTEYGDTDLSLLDEMPAGRRPVKTVWRGETGKEEVYQFVRERVLKGEQAFLVYPVVEGSRGALRSATGMFHSLCEKAFHGFRVGLLHGRMKKDEKASVMKAFREREIQILISTTVVEVGVDVSNATVMVVEHAERFGLAQLHQLRGRVGRGDTQAHCFLLTSGLIPASALERVKAMTSTQDGFRLAEMDLRLRGPGEIMGLAQSGRREGGLVDLRRDGVLAEKARVLAARILEGEPGCPGAGDADLREHFRRKFKNELDLAALS